MDAALQALFDALSDDLQWVFIRWRQYQKLFTEQPRIDLLNASAPFFFWVVQETLWYETLLGISRLAGPPRTAGKDNLSVRQLPPLIVNPVLAAEVSSLVGAVVEKSSFAIKWRNRHIAHRDLDRSLKRTAEPLPPASQAEVDAVLDAMASLLNAIDNHFRRTTTAYRSASTLNDADALVYVIRDGLRREELRQERLEKGGKYDPIDWNDDLPAV